MSVQLAPLAVPQTSIEGWQSGAVCTEDVSTPGSVSFGVKVAQNGRNTLEVRGPAGPSLSTVASASEDPHTETHTFLLTEHLRHLYPPPRTHTRRISIS